MENGKWKMEKLDEMPLAPTPRPSLSNKSDLFYAVSVPVELSLPVQN